MPGIGEFVIPDLLGGSETLMIGRVLWTEFFSNRDWPLASAVAVSLLAFIILPMMLLRGAIARQESRDEGLPPHSCRGTHGRASVPLCADWHSHPYFLQRLRLVTVWGGFSTQWYASLLQNQALKDAAVLSLGVAIASATFATVLGTLAALALERARPGRAKLFFGGLIAAPMVMPEVITGLSLLLLFVALNVERGFVTVTLAHATLTLCFVTMIVQARLATLDRSLEEAAQDLGASPWRVTLTITLPLAMPAIIAGWLLAFTLSLDDS